MFQQILFSEPDFFVGAIAVKVRAVIIDIFLLKLWSYGTTAVGAFYESPENIRLIAPFEILSIIAIDCVLHFVKKKFLDERSILMVI
ncbi:MAG TPA: QVPTGV class sortase B protein-sorting domain-containing protein [Patescibacteria group bacterium]